MKVFNATRHRQDALKDSWDKCNIEFVPSYGPGINSLHPNCSIEDLEYTAKDTVDKAIHAKANAILIGGMTGLAVFIVMEVLDRDLNLKFIEPKFKNRLKNKHSFLGYRDLTDSIRRKYLHNRIVT